MADDELLLGLDLGTSRIKAVLLDGAGTAVRSASAPTPLRAEGDRVECAVPALLEAVAATLADLGDDRRRVVGVGLAGMAEGGAALDRSGQAASALISWNDGRGQAVVDLLHAAFGDDLARAVGQRLRTVSSVAKLGWIVARPDQPPISRWLGVPELVLRALTGAEATEHSLAARTGCWHVTAGHWLDGVAAAAGFGLDVFAPVGTAGDAMGTVTPDGSSWSGLPGGVPATVAGHDHLAGMVGAGVAAGDLANSVGTAETVLGRAARPPDADRALAARVALTVFPGRPAAGPTGPGGDGWALLASGARAGLVLAAAARMLGSAPDQLDAAAEQAGGVVPGSGSELADAVVALAAGDQARLPGGPPGEVWGRILDALVDRTADAAQRVADLAGPAGRLVVFGGGSASRPWLAAKAARLDLPVWRSEVADAVARGAAVFGGVAAGWWGSPAGAPTPALVEAAGPGSAVRDAGPRRPRV